MYVKSIAQEWQSMGKKNRILSSHASLLFCDLFHVTLRDFLKHECDLPAVVHINELGKIVGIDRIEKTLPSGHPSGFRRTDDFQKRGIMDVLP